MTTTCGESVEARASVEPLSGCAPEGSPAAVAAPPPVTNAAPQFMCGVCTQPIDEIATGSWMRCPHCRHSVVIPKHVHVACTRCSHRHNLRVAELATAHMCASCSNELYVADIVLSPRRRHHAHHHHVTHHHRLDKRADAAWAVLIVGLTLLICLLSLILA